MKTAIFIDGGNLYSKLKELGIEDTSKFDYRGLIKSVSKTKKPNYIGYYVGQIRREKGNKKSEKLYTGQQKLFAHLKTNFPNIVIVRGHIQNFEGKYTEKGVDVRLALDIYKLAVEGLYHKAIVISSDTDLLPAIKMVQALGKEVEYIGFSHNPSLALVKECKGKRLLGKRDVSRFEYRKKPERKPRKKYIY
ncbi:MAG: NYN domain-containing protein [Candidatus Peregrinibacteria bacterium]